VQNDNLKVKTGKSYLKQRAYLVALRVIKLIDLLPKEVTAQTIGKQLIRSATSIAANIAEARGSSSKKDFTNFFSYSLKSANESIFWVELLRDSGKAKGIDLTSLLQELNEVANILGSSLLTLRGKRK
jgi:four helix bundle protein